jgi:DNA/RNA-binding domain of Phe-tRNA-synthetase-like protein
MPAFTIDPAFQQLGFAVHVGTLDYDVAVAPSPPALLAAMEDGAEMRVQELLGEAAATDPVIAGVRYAFKACGKDPSRYRPSSEALTRRVIAGKALYHVSNLVDSGNLVSLMTGVPVGIYDTAKINGAMHLTIGGEGDSYKGIGRGRINLEGLPMLRDGDGPFGTPFSDSARTAVSDETSHAVVVLYGLNVDVAHVEAAAEVADTLITSFCAPDA